MQYKTKVLGGKVHRIRNDSVRRANCRECDWLHTGVRAAYRAAQHTERTGHTTRTITQQTNLYARVIEVTA